jgi:PTH2 family peptidyl-tRNA hydrolase
MKQVILVRTDLKLSKGKLAAQVAHASLESYKKADPRKAEDWRRDGGKKVVLKVTNLASLKRYDRKARELRLPHKLIKDAGHTELRPGTVTCLGIGPESEEKIDKATGKLKIL